MYPWRRHVPLGTISKSSDFLKGDVVEEVSVAE